MSCTCYFSKHTKNVRWASLVQGKGNWIHQTVREEMPVTINRCGSIFLVEDMPESSRRNLLQGDDWAILYAVRRWFVDHRTKPCSIRAL